MNKPRFSAVLLIYLIIILGALAAISLFYVLGFKETSTRVHISPKRAVFSQNRVVKGRLIKHLPGNGSGQVAVAGIALAGNARSRAYSPATQLPPVTPEILEHGSRESKRVALTFDLCEAERDHAGFDGAIIDILKQKDVKATFFMGGKWAESHPEDAQMLGKNKFFEIANHSYSHKLFDKISYDEAKAQVVRAQESIVSITGTTPRYFRFPAGRYTPEALQIVGDCGLKAIQWDVVTGDPDPDIKAANMIRAVGQRAHGGSIIIMHANGRGWHTAEALPQIIDILQKRGYTLVTISELLNN